MEKEPCLSTNSQQDLFLQVKPRPFKALVPGSSPGRPTFVMSVLQNWMPIFAAIAPFTSLHAADFDLAARATNQLGIDLHHQLARGDENLCLSPYSIQSALAMTFAGAAGDARTEMARDLHFPNAGEAIHESFATLQDLLEE